MRSILAFLILIIPLSGIAQPDKSLSTRDLYRKTDTLITMRDGIRLYTIIYQPKDNSTAYPILMERTPYSIAPYGDTNYRRSIGPNTGLMREKYIFVYQDVRGRYMSEGESIEVTPHQPNKKSGKQVDESSDTYDTVDWLLKNVANNNGKVGLYGISYPGFYASAALPEAHPAIRAVSPQAPIGDEFIGDDVNHHGAFCLMDNFNFINYYGKERKVPVADYGSGIFNIDSKDMYDFFLKLGPVKNTQSKEYFNHSVPVWNEYLLHDTYDQYWQSRNITQYLKHIKIPALIVGGWFDAEDLYGALHTYQSLEKGETANQTKLVMGPWVHGAWASREWKQFATHDFGSNTSQFFQDSIETPFFNYYLKGKGELALPEATVFETGINKWKKYQSWPPPETKKMAWYLRSNNKLSAEIPGPSEAYDEYLSDPAHPVPYTSGFYGYRNNDFIVEDQRFAAVRPDVVSYVSSGLTDSLSVAGPITAELQVSMTGSDADFIVKLIDVLPANEPNFKNAPRGFQMAGYQRLVRAEVIRGKFRNSLEKPEPFEPGKIHTVRLELNDVAHTFKKGHKIMVQIQSSWFPLFDRNPQTFMTIPEADEKDFIKSNIRIYHNSDHPSKITLPILDQQ